MGKTHLVSLVYYRIKQREDLADRVMIGWFARGGMGGWFVVRFSRANF